MTYLRATVVTVALYMLSVISSAQTPATNQQSTVCQFADGGQLSVRYDPAPVHGDQLPGGHVWSPGEQPMYLFTTKAIKAGATEIPAGAYSLYILPEKQHWTLVVNKDVSSKKYDGQQDLAHMPMDRGTIDDAAKEVSLMLGHIAPKQCSLRLYYGKVGA
jgi:Protein of unknown function (DUF2911)